MFQIKYEGEGGGGVDKIGFASLPLKKIRFDPSQILYHIHPLIAK